MTHRISWTLILTAAATFLLTSTAFAEQATDVFSQDKTAFKFCEAKFVAPIAAVPTHKIWTCQGGIQDVQDGHEISLTLGTLPYTWSEGEIVPDCQGCGTGFGGWDAEGTRYVYWIEGPIDYNNRYSFDNYYTFSDLPHGPLPTQADRDKADVSCGGSSGSSTLAAYEFYAPDDISIAGDKRAMRGRDVLEAKGRTILAMWEPRPTTNGSAIGSYWKNEGQGDLSCRVHIRKGARADSVLDQQEQVEVWNSSVVHVLPGTFAGPKRAEASGQGGVKRIKMPWER